MRQFFTLYDLCMLVSCDEQSQLYVPVVPVKKCVPGNLFMFLNVSEGSSRVMVAYSIPVFYHMFCFVKVLKRLLTVCSVSTPARFCRILRGCAFFH